ncbi:MAG: phosphoketolase family protein [Trueperaceae bacterium]|nr:phosphoketolase family protein [Trueperaceae bacterium]
MHQSLQAYWQAANYLGAAQLYLQSNVLLEHALDPDHVRKRILGHWGTQPGINLIYTHLNRIIRTTAANLLLVTGPGHGAPALFGNLYLEGSLGEANRRYEQSKEGIYNLIRDFSWPYGQPSHLRPFTPGQIQEGGELGYSLGHAYGAAFDHPDLIVACIVGDGEAETGPLAAAWHSNKYLNPVRDGAVLPILHLNGYKIGGLTLLSRLDEQALEALFRGYGYQPIFLELENENKIHEKAILAFDEAYSRIRTIQKTARAEGNNLAVNWPLIIMRSLKGWTGPESLHGKEVEGSFRSHGTPLENPRENKDEFEVLKTWLESYRPHTLFDEQGRPLDVVCQNIPATERQLGRSPYANGGSLLEPLRLPPLNSFSLKQKGQPGKSKASAMQVFANYLKAVFKENKELQHFRIMCPDELGSNKLDAVFEVTERVFSWPLESEDEDYSADGRVMEILSEHTCQAWLEGYLVTGHHGLFPCYEAFVSIVASMAHQFAKWLKVSRETEWRAPIASLNYLLTSHSWRQDHNGFSHQGPGFINTLLNQKKELINIYLPPDANSLLVVADHVLNSQDKINLIVASKQEMPQWLSLTRAKKHFKSGVSEWEWLSQGEAPELVLACAGDVPCQEAAAAARLLRQDFVHLDFRFLNVIDLLSLATDHKAGLSAEKFARLFGKDIPVVFAFHGYPNVIHQLIYDRPNPQRFKVHGYHEEGSTTTPFDMLVRNRMSRFHLAQSCLEQSGYKNTELYYDYKKAIAEHGVFIRQEGVDPDEIAGSL